MKKLLVILLTLFSLHSFAQDTTYVKVRGIPGAYNFSKSGDSLIFYVAGVRHALSVGSTVDLSNYYNKTQVDNSLNGKLDTSYKQSIIAIKPLHWNIITPDSATIGLYVDTTSTLSDGSDTTVPSTKAIKTYVDAHATGTTLVINVRDYGAKGDSSTDNTIAIQAAYNAVSDSNTVVYFPAGKYLVSDSIVISKSCITVGQGGLMPYDYNDSVKEKANTQIIQTDNSKSLFIVNSNGCQFDNVAIVNNSPLSPTSNSSGIKFNYGNSMRLENVSVSNFYININIINGLEWKIDGCELINAYKNNLRIDHQLISDEGDAVISNSWMLGGKYDSLVQIYQAAGGGLKMDNVKFHNTFNGVNYGVAPIGMMDINFNPPGSSIFLINNCSFENFKTFGIRIHKSNSASFSKIIISGNQFGSIAGQPNSSINIKSDSAYIIQLSIVNNTITVYNTDSAAINLQNIVYGNISGNVFYGGTLSSQYKLTNCFLMSHNIVGNIDIIGLITGDTLLNIKNYLGSSIFKVRANGKASYATHPTGWTNLTIPDKQYVDSAISAINTGFAPLTSPVFTGTVTVDDPSFPVSIGGGFYQVKNKYPSGGWARSFSQLLDSTGANLLSIGALGSGQNLTYGYLTSGTTGAYNVTALRFYPNQNVGITNVPDTVGNFLTRASNGVIGKRTASETLSDIGALSTTTAASTYVPLSAILSSSSALDFPSTISNGQSDLTVTVTGAAVGDVVAIGVPSVSATTGTFWGFVSATNTVTVRFTNTSGGSIDPASGTFKVKVFK